MIPPFVGFPKMSRWSRDIIVTEKIDGTNAQIYISEDLEEVRAGSRTRWLTLDFDNFGFASWVEENKEELRKLGPGHHFGEWWGRGIQRGYGLTERRFSLFNTTRWLENPDKPVVCHVVPVLYEGPMDEVHIYAALGGLRGGGSRAALGFMRPEGVVIYHKAANTLFKKLLENDDVPKTTAQQAAFSGEPCL